MGSVSPFQRRSVDIFEVRRNGSLSKSSSAGLGALLWGRSFEPLFCQTLGGKEGAVVIWYVAREGKGYGWTRWSSDSIHERLGLFNNYQLYRWGAQKLFRRATSHNCWHEANRSAQCGKSARWVRCGGGWKRIYGSASEALPKETGSKQIA